MALDLPPVESGLWLPPAPAIIRAADADLRKYGSFPLLPPFVSFPFERVYAVEGGTVTYDGPAQINKFTSSGTLTITAPVTVEYLLVGGGASGGNAGGGAGGVQHGSIFLTPGTYTVTIGAGGASISAPVTIRGNDGGNTSLDSLIIALGGGGGGAYHATDPSFADGRDGGCGGGCNIYGDAPYTVGDPGLGSQGGDGGNAALILSSTYYGSAGGGGGDGNGGNPTAPGGTTTATGGPGGIGFQSAIDGTLKYYAGGGAGAGWRVIGTAGLGGGGNGEKWFAPAVAATAGQANTGGGGGGATTLGAAAGGSGIAIFRHLPAVAFNQY